MQFLFPVIKPRNLYGSVALRTLNYVLNYKSNIYIYGNMTLDNNIYYVSPALSLSLSFPLSLVFFVYFVLFVWLPENRSQRQTEASVYGILFDCLILI